MKRGRGRPKSEIKVDPEQAAVMAVGTGRKELAKSTGLSEHDCEVLKRATKMTADQFADVQREHLQGLLGVLAEQFRAHVDKLTPMQKAVAYGIFADKLANQPKQLTQNLHIHMAKGDAAAAMKALFGPMAQPISARPDRQHSQTPSPPCQKPHYACDS